MEKDVLLNSLIQNIIKITVAGAFVKAASEWVEKGESEADTATVDVTVKVPKLFIDSMNSAIEDLKVANKMEAFCGASVAFHCSRFDIKLPPDFTFPAIPPKMNAMYATERFINTEVANIFSELPAEILDIKKYHDTCDLIGATIMRLGEIDASRNKVKQ